MSAQKYLTAILSVKRTALANQLLLKFDPSVSAAEILNKLCAKIIVLGQKIECDSPLVKLLDVHENFFCTAVSTAQERKEIPLKLPNDIPQGKLAIQIFFIHPQIEKKVARTFFL